MEGLCMILKRFAYPCRYSDMVHRFGRPVPVLSMAANAVTNYVFDTHGHLITDWNPNILHRQALLQYSQAIRAKGASLNNCFGFIDGTVRPISRPGRNQRIVYNGHKRVHAFKIPKCCVTEWFNWELVWTSRYAELLCTFPCVFIFGGDGVGESLTIFL